MAVLAEMYVVLDVETNGLSALRDDLLSISIFQPDTRKMYNKLLPLELDRDVYTTHINGITKKTLKQATPLTQGDVDEFISEFDLCDRTILTYGNLDEKFIAKYFKRKGICGFGKLHFFNFKKNIISSRFSGGNITKDNLCRLYGINNVQELHTGESDCILEWELFKKMDNKKLLITDNKVFEFNNDYIVPASYLANYPNMKYHTQNLNHFKCSSRVVKRFDVLSSKIKKFPTNFDGITIEHLINTMLDVQVIDSSDFLVQNKSKMKYIGNLPSPYDEIYMILNADGTVCAVEEKDMALAEELNNFLLPLKKEIEPLVDYIKKSIFTNHDILSQELVVHRDKNVLALCDLSSDTAVLEIKTYTIDAFDKLSDQLYYESNGRDCYVMQIAWSSNKMTFVISEIEFQIDNSLPVNSLERRTANFKSRISNKQVDVIEYVDSYSKIKLRCPKCGCAYSKSYNAMLNNSECPYCSPPFTHKSKNRKKTSMYSSQDRQLTRAQKYIDKVKESSAGRVSVQAYYGAKEKLIACCNVCGYEWNIRADHLLTRAYCPLCRISEKR